MVRQDSTNIASPIQVTPVSTPQNVPEVNSSDTINHLPIVTKPDTINRIIQQPRQERISVVRSIENNDITRADSNIRFLSEKKKTEISEKDNIINYSYLYQDSVQYSIKPEKLFEDQEIAVISRSKDYKSINQRQKNEGWLLPVIIISILLIVVVKLYYQRFLNQVIQAIINYQLSLKLLREKNVIVRRLFVFLNIHYIIIVSLFLFFSNHYYKLMPDLTGFKGFSIILGGFLIFNLGRFILQSLTAFIFNCTPIVKEYLHNIFLINKNIGLFLLPLTIIAIYISDPFKNILLFIGLVALVISIIYQFIRGFTLIIKKGVLLFYSFLYFCTLEILPVLLGTKFLMSLR